MGSGTCIPFPGPSLSSPGFYAPWGRKKHGKEELDLKPQKRQTVEALRIPAFSPISLKIPPDPIQRVWKERQRERRKNTQTKHFNAGMLRTVFSEPVRPTQKPVATQAPELPKRAPTDGYALQNTPQISKFSYGKRNGNDDWSSWLQVGMIIL